MRTPSVTTSRRLARILVGGALAATVGVAAACGSSPSSTKTTSGATTSPPSGGGTESPGSTAPSTTAPPSTSATPTALKSVLTTAYEAETGALATYRAVVTRLGEVGPFPNVVTSEQRHVATISQLFTTYGLTTPSPSAGVASPSTLHAACELGVKTEENLVTMYEQSMPKVASDPVVTRALDNLKAASEESHLPAFEHC